MVTLEVLKQIAEDVNRFTRTETIFGEPMEIQGTTIIPVCRIAVGYGGGGGEGEEAADPKHSGKGVGAGGGAGLRIDPAALIVFREGKISIVPIGRSESRVGSLLDKLPDLFDRMKTAKDKNPPSNAE